MQAGNRRVKEQRRDDERSCPLSRQTRHSRKNPEQSRHDSDMQTGDREQMQRAGLLEWLFDVVRRLMAESQDHAVDRAGDIRRIFEAAANRGLHPRARSLGRAQNSIAATTIHESAVFWITDNQRALNVLAREVGAHVEFAWIARSIDWLRGAEESDLIAEFNGVPPADKQFRAHGVRFTIDFDRCRLQKKRRRSASGNFWLGDHRAAKRYRTRLFSERAGQLCSRRTKRSRAVQKEKAGRHKRVNDQRAARNPRRHRHDAHNGHDNHRTLGPIVGRQNSQRRRDREAEKWLAWQDRREVHFPGGGALRSYRSRPRKPLIHLYQLICLRRRADSFFEKKPKEYRSPGHGGRRR